jgi:hypothetical protein
MDPILDELFDTLNMALHVIQESATETQLQHVLPVIQYVQDGIFSVGIALDNRDYRIDTLKNAIRNVVDTVRRNRVMFESPIFGNFLPLLLQFLYYINDNVFNTQNEISIVARAA